MLGDNAGIQRNIIRKTGEANKTAELYKIKFSKLKYNRAHHVKKKWIVSGVIWESRKTFQSPY